MLESTPEEMSSMILIALHEQLLKNRTLTIISDQTWESIREEMLFIIQIVLLERLLKNRILIIIMKGMWVMVREQRMRETKRKRRRQLNREQWLRMRWV